MLKVIKTFYRFVLAKKYWFILFMVTNSLSMAVYLISPYFFKLFVDAIEKLDSGELMKLLIVYMVVRIFGVIFSNLRYLLGDIVVIDAGIAARVSVFKHVQDLDFAFHTNKSTGSLISAIKRGDGAFFNLFERIHYTIFEVIFGFLIMFFFFTQIDYRIVLSFLFSLVATISLLKFLIGKNIAARNRHNKVEDEVSAIIVDNMINYETVKLFSKEKRELFRLRSTFKDWKKYLWDFSITFRYIDVSIGILISLAVFLVLYFSINLVIRRQISLGDFVLITTFISMFFPKLFDLVYGLRDIAKNYSDINTYFSILDENIEVQDPVHEKTMVNVSGKVDFDNVSFSYKEGRPRAVKNINLKIKPGESIALVGRSGVGKTTLVRLLMRFFDVDTGSIKIDGVNIKDFSKSRLRSFMGVVPQEPILFNNTIGYNIAYGANKATQKEIQAAAKMANLDTFIETLPEKYETHVGERGIKLSGGQKQRLAIARMILSDPDIVIFDEATSQLDSESEKLIQDAFWKAVKNKTTIIIAHRLSTVMKADRIIVMEKGRIAEEGSHRELLMRKDSLYRHFWELQITSD